MALLQRSVQFKGINVEVEDQKTERRAEKLRRKKARKMAYLARNEDIRYFLYFLETVEPVELHRQISESEEAMAQVTLLFPRRLFPNLATQDDKLGAFATVVRAKALPASKKSHHCDQMEKLGAIMDLWERDGKYDSELDRFYQHLRVLSVGQGALEDHFAGVVPEDRTGLARQLAQSIRTMMGAVGSVPASAMPPRLKNELRQLKNQMRDQGAYDSGDNGIRSTSSGESSDDSDVEEVFHI